MAGASPAALTPRQLEVLELMAKGSRNREIAGVLGISAATVKRHVSAVIVALDVTNRTEAAVALQELSPARSRHALPQRLGLKEDWSCRPGVALPGGADRPCATRRGCRGRGS